MPNVQFEIYETSNGKRPFQDFLDNLSDKDAAKLLRTLQLIEEFGFEGVPESYTSPLGDGLFEIRVRFSSNIQRCIYFHYLKQVYVITHGFTKKSQKTPQREIEIAKRYRKEHRERSQNEK